MATPNPDSFDYFKRGEPLKPLVGKADPTSFDHFRRGEPFKGLDSPTAAGTIKRRSFITVIG